MNYLLNTFALIVYQFVLKIRLKVVSFVFLFEIFIFAVRKQTTKKNRFLYICDGSRVQ